MRAQTKHIPLGDRTTVNGEIVACYGLDDYKKLLKFDADLDTCLQVRPKLELKVKLLEEAKADFKQALNLQKLSTKLMTEDRDLWFERWKEENKKRHLAENKPAFGSYLAWGAAGVFAVSTAVLTAIVVSGN